MTIQQALLMVSRFATWNPSDKATGITLSNGDLTVTSPDDGAISACRATAGKSSGKWYWEVTIGSLPGVVIGAATTAMPTSTYVGGSGGAGTSWGYQSSTGEKLTNLTDTAYGASFTSGDVIGVALDMDGGTITFYKNGVSQGQAFSGISGTVFPAMSDINTVISITANFGATAFIYTPPAEHGPVTA